jgi:hypothetical protein
MSLKDALKRANDEEASVRVIVELNTGASREAAEEDLSPLRELGLDVERVIGNKVVGSVGAKKLAAIRALPSVRAVERSEKLSLHRRSTHS